MVLRKEAAHKAMFSLVTDNLLGKKTVAVYISQKIALSKYAYIIMIQILLKS